MSSRLPGSVLVTGGAGLLGVTWAVVMRHRQAVTLAVHQRSVSLVGVTTRPTSLESVDQLARALEDTRPDLVVHAAGITNIEVCEAQPELARHVNVQLSENVAIACARAGVSLAHISTDHLFSAQGDRLIDEGEPVSPTNVYGQTKAEGESRVLDAHPNAMVIRTNFYGWGPPYRQSFSDVIINTLRDNQSITLFDDVTYTPILMEPLIRAVHDLAGRRARGVFNVVGDDCISKHEFGVRVARAFDLDVALIEPVSIAARQGLVARPRRMGLSNRKATETLGRTIGGVSEHLAALVGQERSASVKEIHQL